MKKIIIALLLIMAILQSQEISVIYGGGDIYEVVLRDSITVAYVVSTGAFAFTPKGMKFVTVAGDTIEIIIKDEKQYE